MRTHTLLSAAFFALPATSRRARVEAACPCGLTVRVAWRGDVPPGVRWRLIRHCACGETHEHLVARVEDADAPIEDLQPNRPRPERTTHA